MNTLGIALVLGLLCLWPVVAGAGEAARVWRTRSLSVCSPKMTIMASTLLLG